MDKRSTRVIEADARTANAEAKLAAFALDYMRQINPLATSAEVRKAFVEMKGRVF